MLIYIFMTILFQNFETRSVYTNSIRNAYGQ